MLATETATSNGKPAKGEELAKLAEEIKDALGRAEQSELERLTHYRSAGEYLTKAKKLCPHGSWEGWLKGKFGLSDRQAQKYMRFAKAPRKALSAVDPKASLAEEKKLWAKASGAGGKAKGSDKAAQPKLPDDGSRVIQLPKEVADELDVKLIDLRMALLSEKELTDGLDGVEGTPWAVAVAVRFVHRAVCGQKEVALVH